MTLTQQNSNQVAKEVAAIEMAYKMNALFAHKGKVTLISEGYDIIKERYDKYIELNNTFK